MSDSERLLLIVTNYDEFRDDTAPRVAALDGGGAVACRLADLNTAVVGGTRGQYVHCWLQYIELGICSHDRKSQKK